MTERVDHPMPTRTLGSGQQTLVWIADLAGSLSLVHTDERVLLEAPNWSPDGQSLLLNGAGRLWRLDLADGGLATIPIDGLPPINNDHVLDPDGRHLYLSANDGQIYRAPIAGGAARRVTHDPTRFHFLHGVSPDGATLAYVDLPATFDPPIGRLALMSSAGGPPRYPDAGRAHLDGPEYSPDGDWLYFNTETFGTGPGHAQLARVPASGGTVQRLVESDTVDWFPHLSPDGLFATYISFPAGTLGHPADLPVEVTLVRTEDWTRPHARLPVFGGQGTLNVNSWSPDSGRFAFVSYPIEQNRA